MPRSPRAAAAAALLALVSAAASGWVRTVHAGSPPPGAPSCPMLPADNVWNTDISALPVDPHNDQWIASMGGPSLHIHPDFGPSGTTTPYGIPYQVVTNSHQFVNVTFQYASESDPGPYPLGPDTPIENGSDRHALVVDSDTCTLYETFATQYANGQWSAGSGAIFDMRSNALRPDGWTSADAAGLPMLPGLIRRDEVTSGAITHAIRFTAQSTDTLHIWPARHDAGSAPDPSLPPMGARFRLRGDVDISHFLPETQVVLSAMQHYGLILADNGSNWYFGGAAENGWDSSVLDELKSIPAGDFQAVDESSLMVSQDSGQARQTGAGQPVLAGVAGSDSQLWTSPGGGRGFTPLGGVLTGAPAIAWVPGVGGGGSHLYVVTGTDHQLWTRTDSAGWQRLSTSTIYCVDNPALLVSGAAGQTTATVACKGSDQQLYANWASVTAGVVPSFGGFGGLGGVLTAGPAVSAVGGQPTFFAVGNDQRVYTRQWSTAFSPSPWSCKGHPAAGSAGPTTYFGCHGTDGQLWYATNAGSGWSGAVPAGGVLVDGVGVAPSGGQATFFVEGSDKAVYEETVTPGGPPGGWTRDGGSAQFGAGAA